MTQRIHHVSEPESSNFRVPVFVIGLIAILAVLFLIGKALFLDTGGASSPEEAVQDLAGAISNEDIAGALAALSPNEVSAIGETYQAGVDKVAELGLTGDGGTFGFLDLEVSGLDLDVKQLDHDIAKVTITNGRATAEFHPERLEPKLKDAVGADDPRSEKSEVTAADLRAEIDGEQVDPFVVAVRDEGGWYVSPFHTLAEYLMIGADDDVPRPTYTKVDLPPAAPTPVAAVQRLVDAVNAREIGGVIDSVSADEWAVLHTYRTAIEYLAADRLEGQDADDVTIDDIQLAAEEVDDGRAIVKVKSFTAHVTVGPETGRAPALDDVVESDGPEFDGPEFDGPETDEAAGSLSFGEVSEEERASEFSFSEVVGPDPPPGPAPDPPPAEDVAASELSFGEAATAQEAAGELSFGEAAAPEAPSDDPVTYTMEFDGTCVRIDGGDEHLDSCARRDDPRGIAGEDPLFAFGRTPFDLFSVVAAQHVDDLGIVVVAERDGWAVSPLETLFGALTAGIEGVTPETFASWTGTAANLPPQAKVAMDQSTEVTINDDGFAVLGVKATKGDVFELSIDDDDASVGEISEPDGHPAAPRRIDLGSVAGVVDPSQTGEYRAVVHGTPGSKVTVTMQPYLVPTVAVGEPFEVDAPADGWDHILLKVPEDMVVVISNPELGMSNGYALARWIHVSAGDDAAISIGRLGGDRFRGTVTIRELGVEAIEPSGSTPVKLDVGEVRAYRFVAAKDQTPLEETDGLQVTLIGSDGDPLGSTELREGAEYLVLVESFLDAPDSGTLRFAPLGITVDGGGPLVDAAWDPARTDQDHTYEVAVPGGQGALVQVIPSLGLDPHLDVSCAVADGVGPWSGSSEIDGGAGLPDWVGIPPSDQDRVCQVTMTAEEGAGSYRLTVDTR